MDRYYESNANALKQISPQKKIVQQNKNIGKSAMITKSKKNDLYSDLGVSRRFERQNIKKNIEEESNSLSVATSLDGIDKGADLTF